MGKRILLVMPTFWDVIAPPVGIISLKSYLEQFGHSVQTANLNVNNKLWNTQHQYFRVLENYVPNKSLVPRIGSEFLGLHLNAKVFEEEVPPQFFHDFLRIALREKFLDLLAENTEEEMNRLVVAIDQVATDHFKHVCEAIPGLLSTDPEFVGFTGFSSTYGTGLYMLKEIKRQNPSIKAIVGGSGPYNGFAHDSPNMTRLLETCTFVDQVIFGEGEQALRMYVEGDFKEGRLIHSLNLGLPFIEMDDLPILDYSDVDLSKYFNLGVNTSRGCPFLCSFCSETKSWGSFRRMSPDKTIEAVQAQVGKISGNNIFMTDSLFNQPITPFSKKAVERNLDINFDCYLRVDRFSENPKYVDLWSKAGLSRVRFGMESASPKMLEVMVKEITQPQMENSLRTMGEAGVQTTTYWIVGHPHETEEDFQETLDFIHRNKDHIFEVDFALFYFYGEGEIGKDDFTADFGGVERVFPEEYDPLSIFTYYKLKNPHPTRSESFKRAVRFTALMKEWNIPCNRSSIMDLMTAEKRWQRLTGRGAAILPKSFGKGRDPSPTEDAISSPEVV